MLKPYYNKNCSSSRFYDKTGIAKHREWRGLSNTAYDYVQWLINVGYLVKFVASAPVRVVKGILEYRWMGSYLSALHLVDKCVEGLSGPALQVAHEYMHAIMKGAVDLIPEVLKGDRRLGENSFSDRQVLTEQAMPTEIVSGFPNLKVLPLETFQGILGTYVDQTLAPHYIDLMEKYGLPADSCRLSSSGAGVAIADDFALCGKCLLVNNLPCDSSTMNTQLMARRIELPTMLMGIPMRWEDESIDKYAVMKMKETLAFIQEHTGDAFDEKYFMKMMEKHNDEVRTELQTWDYLPTEYTPFGVTTNMLIHMFGYAFSGGKFEYVTSAHEKCLKIAERAYKEKINCFPKTRHRAIFWGGSPCYYLHHPNWMYNCWGILTVLQMFNVEGNVIIDTSSLDSALLGVAKNHEHGIMRRHLTGGWQHMLEVFEYAHRFNCDIIMINDDITCKGALGMTGMITEKSREYPNIKLMWVSNDMLDHRTISRNDMRQQVNEFMTAVMQEKPLDETLLDFDDYEGW